jgi:hypothetical protein
MISSSRSLLLALVATLVCAQAIPFGYAANREAVPSTPQSKTLDPGWPREITRNGVRLVYYQPQVDEWKNLRELRTRFAFVLTPNNGKPVVGVEEVRGDTQTDLERRTVLIDNIEIVGIRFPSSSGAEETKLQNLLRSTFPKGPNNLYAGHDGNVYKRDDNGDWSKWDNGGWQPRNTQGRGQNDQSRATTTDKKSRQTSRQQSNGPAGTGRTSVAGAKGEGSNDLTSGLDREASARQSGSQNVNLQQKHQQRRTQRSQGSTVNANREVPEKEPVAGTRLSGIEIADI